MGATSKLRLLLLVLIIIKGFRYLMVL